MFKIICICSQCQTPDLVPAQQTASSITFAVYMLAENPQVCKRLRQEILEILGESRRPSFEDMKDMKYLRAVINETMRLYPAMCVSELCMN